VDDGWILSPRLLLLAGGIASRERARFDHELQLIAVGILEHARRTVERAGDLRPCDVPLATRPGWVNVNVNVSRRPRIPAAAKWTDCGDPDCPIGNCAGVIARRLEALHRRVVCRTAHFFTDADRGRLWTGELVSETQAHRCKYVRATRRRVSRAKEKTAPPKVLAPLNADHRSEALELLRTWTVRRVYLDPDRQRREWTNNVWLEIEVPPADTDLTEPLGARVQKAVWRAERLMKKEHEIPDP
jgi:hypothetical protein